MREIINLNNNWQYSPHYHDGMEYEKVWKEYDHVHLPHTNRELPYNYFDEKQYQLTSCYRLSIQVDNKYRDKIAVIRFEGVMAYAKVFLNGNYLGEHKGGYTPFEFSVTDLLDFDEENILTVIVDSTEREDIPPFGGQIDYLTYGGIYREVSLAFYDKVYIKNAFIKAKEIYETKKELEIDIYSENCTLTQQECYLNIKIMDAKENVIYDAKKEIVIDEESSQSTVLFQDIENVELWDIDHPHLYNIQLQLELGDYSDTFSTKIGFRECLFKSGGFYLNNKKVKIRGLNRHQSFPYVGYAMPKRVQEKDAEILKKELHLNLVRTSHYPQSIHFLNKCDELGLLVFEEIPGWQHIGDEAWKQTAIKNVEEMVIRDWNHPSIILWGVRINESKDDDTFYTETNRLARSLDPTRQTGGVRCIEDSTLLEDVYTMNDFVHDGGEVSLRNQQDVTHLNIDVPYLVTEYNGHMYPTKKFDQEERQMEHVLRHLRVQNASYGIDNITGAIGWCAFDYNTHKDFGAGDRICYHGVMDMFRIKKFAAYAYQSQVSPEVEAVLEPVTFWARGERSVGGVLPLLLLTNCDYVEFKYGNFPTKTIQRTDNQLEYLPYPPIIIDETVISPSEIGQWGMEWEDCIITGYVNNKKVIERRLVKDPIPTNLDVQVDDKVLSSVEKDATRVVIKAMDQQGNILPYLDEVVRLEVKGVGRVIGPSTLVLKGGSIAFWVETFNQPGSIEINITSTHFQPRTLKVEVK